MSNHLYLNPEIRYGKTFSDYANSFRHIALNIHDNPNSIVDYFHLPAIDFLVSDCDSTTLQRTQFLEALSYGDPGVLMASPGPSLSGIAMRELAMHDQRRYFFNTVKKNKIRTCFALTEPTKGSDASQIQTRLNKENNHFYLDGQKCFFGNGAVAEMGVVFAKLNDTPVGLQAIFLTPDILNSSTVQKETLQQFSLRGAQIGVMQFHSTDIPAENILGQHLSSCQNGLVSIIKIFNQYRTGVGALAIGQAQGVLDLCYQKYESLFRLSELYNLYLELSTAREFLQHAAKTVDQNVMQGVAASSAKNNAVNAALSVISKCVDTLPFEIVMSEPWILKSYADAFCWEFMEGTSHLHHNLIAREIRKNDIARKRIAEVTEARA